MFIVFIVFQALPYVMLLIAMLFFIYAIIGMQVCKVYLLSSLICRVLIAFIHIQLSPGTCLLKSSEREEKCTDLNKTMK